MITESIYRDFISKIEALQEGLVFNMDSFKLTQKESEILKTIPEETMAQVDKQHASYTPTVGFDVRKELTLKGIAQILLNADAIDKAAALGYSMGEVIES
jgi:hypothetical protein